MRREYYWVPGSWFSKKRAELLEAILARPRPHTTDRLREALAESARADLTRSIARLRGTG